MTYDIEIDVAVRVTGPEERLVVGTKTYLQKIPGGAVPRELIDEARNAAVEAARQFEAREGGDDA